ncbi:transketolase beta subunit [Corallococcus sp. CAG:1435]|uniref:Transketolase n=1 Tax=Candidatus Fimimonas gallinarum TaxID=2840821 RepID=A0A9D1E447_9BACT|nr:transketolase beta subunit [Corallococcus sp. CAG:1435]HIR65744.1 transketolase [Candidatus Fimimonas gallinarum]
MDTVQFSKQIRRELLRCLHSQGSGHVGGSLSIVDVLAVLYSKHMDVDPKNPKRPNRDCLVLSKGHAGPAWYATLALKGFFPLDWLDTLNKLGTRLPSHANLNLTPGVDMTAGSLGQGLSCACGLALAKRMDGDNHFVYVITGDGELQEGQNWEAAMFAASHKLDNMIVFVDCNKLQIDGTTAEVCDLGDIQRKFEAFGFISTRVNGHDHDALDKAISKAKQEKGAPHCIVMDTIKGKGVSFYEQMGAGVHSTTVTDEQYKLALEELK